MSLAPQGGSDNSNNTSVSRGGDSITSRTSESFLKDVGSSYLSDVKSLTSSPGFGGPNDKTTDPQTSLDAGLQTSPYSTVFSSPGAKTDATGVTTAAPDTTSDTVNGKSTSTDGGGDRLATVGDRRTTESAEPTKPSFDPGERRTLAQSGGGGC